MSREQELTIRLGVMNEVLDYLRAALGRVDAMERIEWEREIVRAEIRRLTRAKDRAPQLDGVGEHR